MGYTPSAASRGVSTVVHEGRLDDESLDGKNYDDEMAKMQAEIEKIDQEEKRLEKQETLEL